MKKTKNKPPLAVTRANEIFTKMQNGGRKTYLRITESGVPGLYSAKVITLESKENKT